MLSYIAYFPSSDFLDFARLLTDSASVSIGLLLIALFELIAYCYLAVAVAAGATIVST
jgi:hypothetical protein